MVAGVYVEPVPAPDKPEPTNLNAPEVVTPTKSVSEKENDVYESDRMGTGVFEAVGKMLATFPNAYSRLSVVSATTMLHPVWTSMNVFPLTVTICGVL